MSRGSIIENGGFPVLVETNALLGSPAPSRKSSLSPRPRTIGRQGRPSPRPRPGYIDGRRAAVELSCDVGKVADIASAAGVPIEEVGGVIYFSEAGLELAADRRRPPRSLPASGLTPDDSRAGECLADAAKRLGISEDALTSLALGKVEMTTRDGEVYLRSRDLKRVEGEQGLDRQAKARSAPSPLAPAPADSATEERTAAAAQALGITATMESSEAEPDGGTQVTASRERMRIGRPRRWSAR